MSASVTKAGSNEEWFGHPPQLARLFTTEMWERFGYYGMRAVLVLYLTKHFVFDDHVAGGLYGAFTSLVYLTPLFGGIIADRYLGYKQSVKLGAVLMSIGYFVLCFGGKPGQSTLTVNEKTYSIVVEKTTDENKKPIEKQVVELDAGKYRIDGQKDGSVQLLPEAPTVGEKLQFEKGKFEFGGKRDPWFVSLMFLSLSSIIIGNGFFKPNISTMVGSLYPVGDARRDSGFTIFYMGINIGAMLSQLLCPLLAETVGAWAGFGLAAIGMFASFLLIQFDGGRLNGYGESPVKYRSIQPIIMIGAVLAVPVVWFLLQNTLQSIESSQGVNTEGQGVIGYIQSLPILGKILFAVFLLSAFGIPSWSFAVGTRIEALRMLVAIVLIVFSVVFWTLFEQAGSSLTLFADRNTDRSIFGWEMPAGQVQVFNAIFIVALAPVFSWIWMWLGKRGLEPSIPIKFAFALACVGIGFLALVFGANFASNEFKVGLSWLILAYLIHSIGELCISPVGLSMITKLSMPAIVGLMMGVWFVSSAVAQYVGGIVAQFAAVDTVGGEVTNLESSLNTYIGVFKMIGYAGILFAIVLLVLAPFLNRMIREKIQTV